MDDKTSSWILIDLIMSSHGTQLNLVTTRHLKGFGSNRSPQIQGHRQRAIPWPQQTTTDGWSLDPIFGKISGKKHQKTTKIKGPTAKAKWKTLPSWTTRNCPITLPKTHLHLFAPFFLFNSPCTLRTQIVTNESSSFQPLYLFEGM